MTKTATAKPAPAAPTVEVCRKCKGTGHVKKGKACARCKGTGTYTPKGEG